MFFHAIGQKKAGLLRTAHKPAFYILILDYLTSRDTFDAVLLPGR